MTFLLLLVHITEVPRDIHVYILTAPHLLISLECVVGSVCLPFAGVECTSPVDSKGKCLVEEVLAQTEVKTETRFAISLCDDALRV